MKKNFLLFGIVLFTGMFAMQSCVVEGCTDSDATNYDSEANSDDGSCTYIYGCTDYSATNYDSDAGMDDGSCEYEGQAMWWIGYDLGVGTINVYFRGYYEGQISSYYSYAPSCDASGCVTATYDTGSYLWYARADDGTYWSGSWITIYANDCSTMKLTLKKDGKPSMELVSDEGNADAIPQPIAN
jgi:hypothetical protein